MRGRSRPSAKSALSAAVIWGGAVALVSRPATGVAAAAALVVAARVPWGRLACRCMATAVLIALPVYVVLEQVRHHYWPDIAWPGDMGSANDIAWLGLAILGSDAVAGALYARRRMERSE